HAASGLQLNGERVGLAGSGRRVDRSNPNALDASPRITGIVNSPVVPACLRSCPCHGPRSIEEREMSLMGTRSTRPAEGGTILIPGGGRGLLEFQLIEELGRGAFSRVYLARQGKLADRPVVLKVSPRPDAEPRVLAQLQHTNIVPIYSIHRVERLQ